MLYLLISIFKIIKPYIAALSKNSLGQMAGKAKSGRRFAMTSDQFDVLQGLSKSFERQSLCSRMADLRAQIEGTIVFTTSLGMEDQAITHAIFSQNLDIDIVTLDTGRLFGETYELWAMTEEKYGKKIRAICPQNDELEKLVAKQGPNGFYINVQNRKECCRIRKVLPLKRALAGADLWITGLRGDQSIRRQNLSFVELDSQRNIHKVNPVLDWTEADLLKYIDRHKIPVNKLHSKGFPSIGCQPCTRAIKPGEHLRAGRWWWEGEGDETTQECGLHLDADGKLVRASQWNSSNA
jgi:phosphoadenosine phosphosulfate reductase